MRSWNASDDIQKSNSRSRPSTRHFQGIKACFHIVEKLQKDSANHYGRKYISALGRSFWPHEDVKFVR